MEGQNYKCKVHIDIDATKCCGECNTYFCTKCEKYHSEIFKNHKTFRLDNDADELFTGFCQEKNIKTNSIIFVRDIILFAVLHVYLKLKREKMEIILIAKYVI